MNGVSGVIAPLIVGFLRTVQLSKDKTTDIVPVDYASNALICVMWDTVNRYSLKDIINYMLQVHLLCNHLCSILFVNRYRDGNKRNKVPKIYNFVSSVESSINWDKFLQYTFETYRQVPPLESIWYMFCIFSANRWVVRISRFILHRIPGALVDLSFIIRGKNPK